MTSHINHKVLNASEDFGLLLHSKLITFFFDNFTLRKKVQSYAYLLRGSEHIYCILNLEVEVHSRWILWTSKLEECKGNVALKLSEANNNYARGCRITGPSPNTLPLKVHKYMMGSWLVLQSYQGYYTRSLQNSKV